MPSTASCASPTTGRLLIKVAIALALSLSLGPQGYADTESTAGAAPAAASTATAARWQGDIQYSGVEEGEPIGAA